MADFFQSNSQSGHIIDLQHIPAHF